MNRKEKVTQLYKNGWSYNIISKKTGVAKSTLSHWLREIPHTPNATVRKRIREGPAKSGEIRHKKRMDHVATMKEIGRKEVGSLSKRDLLMLSIGLYIGEGSKTYENVQISNADPKVIQLSKLWLEQNCKVPKENILVKIHIYSDNDEQKALQYWSNVTNLPLSQFGKTQIDRRKNKKTIKKRLLPHGTAHLKVRALGKKEFGVELHRKISGWIEAVYN